MKIALVSDLHIHNWREFSEPGEQGVPTRLGHCADVLADVGNYATDNEVTTVVIGGDIFHKRGVLYTQAYNLVVAHLSWMKDLGLTVLVVDGNHDHADKAGRVHAVEALSSAGLVRSIQPEYGFENWHLSSDDHSESMVITGVSYCDGMDAFERRLDKAEGEARADYDGEDRIFVFHHGFKDARVGTRVDVVIGNAYTALVPQTEVPAPAPRPKQEAPTVARPCE